MLRVRCRWLQLLLLGVPRLQAVPDRRMPAEDCVDVQGWKDSENYTCEQYRADNWCTTDGGTGTGWQSRWNVMETYWHHGHSAISACCACGGGQVSHIDGMWQVVRGPCTIDGECIQSPNYPGNYSDNQRCTIVVNASLAKPLKIIHWNVEYWFDYLHVNGKFFSGRTAPPEGEVPSGAIQWSSDEDTNGTGWRLCASAEIPPATSTISTSLSGTSSAAAEVSTTTAASTNTTAPATTAAAATAAATTAATTAEPTASPTTLPATTAPAASCRDVPGWTDLGDFSCEEYVSRQWCTRDGGTGPNWQSAWGGLDDYWRRGYTAVEACCDCGGGDVQSVSGPWQVLRGGCQIVDNCIQSPNYPANYSNDERCTIVTNSSLMTPLQMVDFNTERFYDILSINEMQFSGQRRPVGITPRGTIAWKSDEDIQNKGWKLCLGPKLTAPADGGIFSVLEGSCAIDAQGCALSPNFPAEYPALEGCIIQVYNPGNKTIAASEFTTEAGYDVLWVNGRRYSGTNSPNGVVPTEPLQWNPDEDVQRSGWKLCPGPVGQPGSPATGALDQNIDEDYGYGNDGSEYSEDNNEDPEPGAVGSSLTDPPTGFLRGNPGISEDSTSPKAASGEDLNSEPEINGTLPFGKIVIASAAICLAGVLFIRCRRNQDKGYGGYSTSYGRSYALDNL